MSNDIFIIMVIRFLILFTCISLYLLFMKIFDYFMNKPKDKYNPETIKNEYESMKAFILGISEVEEDKREKYITKNKKKIENYSRKMRIIDKMVPPQTINSVDIENTEKIKALIDDAINSELNAKLNRALATGEKYDLKNVDIDIKEMSTNIINGLNPAIFKTNLVFTNEYIMKYIVSQTTIILIRFVTEYNLAKIEEGQ